MVGDVHVKVSDAFSKGGGRLWHTWWPSHVRSANSN